MPDSNPPQSKRETIQRIQVGFLGLLGVLMIVGLANVMTHNARLDEGSGTAAIDGAVNPGASTNASAAAPSNNEPLADLGVTPSNDPALSTAPAVPDLEPDPRLTTRMDRDPRQENGSR